VNQLAAVILISDGQHTTPDDPVEIARQAKQKGIPVYVIGVGDPSRPRNLFVDDIYVRAKAQPNEPFEIETVMYAQNIEPGNIQVELVRQTIDAAGKLGDPQTMETQSVAIPTEGGRLPLNFSQTVAEPGNYVYRVKMPPAENEVSLDDNEKVSSQVEVVDEKVKVLLIAGAPTWEYQLVQRLLQRDPSIILSCWLQTMDEERPQEGNEPIVVLPRTLEEMGKYNVIMLFDPDPKEMDADWINALAAFAEKKAGGVLFNCGPKFTDLFLALERTRKIREILPVVFSESGAADDARFLLTSNSSAANMQLVLPNLDHPVMTFHQNRRDNLTRWQTMPGVYWSYPALRAKPTARVLLEHSDITLSSDGQNARPLLVAGRYVRGNTVFMGFNGTWRWRRMGRQAQFFDRFWIQIIRYLAETRDLQGLRRGVVEPERDEYELGDRMVFHGRFQDPRFEPLVLPAVDGSVTAGDGEVTPISFKPLEGLPGEYETVMAASKIGEFTIKVNLPGASESEGIEPITFRVAPPSVESDASGGKYLCLAEIGKLPELISTDVSEIEWLDRPEPLWDQTQMLRMFCFSTLLLLLTVEWAVRKGFKLL
jgi:von Willebrand factor type A domain